MGTYAMHGPRRGDGYSKEGKNERPEAKNERLPPSLRWRLTVNILCKRLLHLFYGYILLLISSDITITGIR